MPCSISATALSAVITRGLEMILPRAVGLQRRQFQVQEAVGGRREQADGQRCRRTAVDRRGRQVDELGVVVARSSVALDLAGGFADAGQVAADADARVAVADLVAGVAAADGAHVGEAELGAEVAREASRWPRRCAPRSAPAGGDVGLARSACGCPRAWTAMSVHEQLVGARLDDGAAALGQHAVLAVAAGALEAEHGREGVGLLVVELEDLRLAAVRGRRSGRAARARAFPWSAVPPAARSKHVPFLRMSRPLACSIMSSAWSHGTSFRRRVRLPLTRVAGDDVQAGDVGDGLQRGAHFDVLEVERQLLAAVALACPGSACSGPP